MTKLLSLVSSYRKNGNTSRLVQLILEQLQELAFQTGEPLESETLNLGRMELQPCRGCRVCFDRGEQKCPLKDDLPAIKAKMKAADGIIFASPVYVNDVNGIMKNLIDRLAHVCHRPEFAGKPVYFVVTTGSSPTSHAVRTLQGTVSWGFHLVGAAGFKMGAYMPDDEMHPRFGKDASKAARQIFAAIRKRDFVRPSFYSLMAFRIQQHYWRRHQDDSLDSVYWRSNGWTEAHCEYYVPHAASRPKALTARLVGTLLARFVT